MSRSETELQKSVKQKQQKTKKPSTISTWR